MERDFKKKGRGVVNGEKGKEVNSRRLPLTNEEQTETDRIKGYQKDKEWIKVGENCFKADVGF